MGQRTININGQFDTGAMQVAKGKRLQDKFSPKRKRGQYVRVGHVKERKKVVSYGRFVCLLLQSEHHAQSECMVHSAWCIVSFLKRELCFKRAFLHFLKHCTAQPESWVRKEESSQ